MSGFRHWQHIGEGFAMATMPLVFNNPGHWNQRAVEARQMADRMIGPCAR
jgi:hypothetical protein